MIFEVSCAGKEKREAAADEHRRLWPTSELPRSALGFNRGTFFKGQDDDDSPENVQFWCDCSTIPTSMAMSFLFWGMTHSKRMPTDKLLSYLVT